MSHSPFHPRLQKIVSPDVLQYRFVHRFARKFLNILRISWAGSSDHAYPELSYHCLKTQKQFVKFFRLKDPAETPRIVFTTLTHLNTDCLAEDKHREPKLVWSEPSDHEDSKCLSKFSCMSVNETTMQSFQALHEKFVWLVDNCWLIGGTWAQMRHSPW